MGSFWVRILRALGAAGAVVGCGAMAAMLPGVTASVFGGLGLAGSSVVGRALDPVAEPLFIVSAVLVIVGALACSWLATVLAGGGSVLAYLSMFVLTTGGSSSMADMGAMDGAHANGALFVVGAALLVASFVVPLVRRRRETCSPVLARFRRPATS